MNSPQRPDQPADVGVAKPRQPGLSVGQPFGISVRVSPWFLGLGVIVGLYLRPQVAAALPGSSAAAATVLGYAIGGALLLSVALHELAHAVVGKALGLPVQGIFLHFLGGVTSLGEEPQTPARQYLVTIAGPLVNISIGGVAAAVFRTADVGTMPHVAAGQIAASNAALALYNLLPGLPLDGGQVVRAGIWGLTGDKVRGLRAAGIGGLITGGLTIVFGLTVLQGSRGQFGLFTLFIGYFVASQALRVVRTSVVQTRLPAVVAGRLARRAYTVAPDLPLAEALRRAGVDGARAVLLGDGPRPVAIMVGAMVDRVPVQRRPWVPISSVARALSPGLVLDATLSGDALLEALRSEPASEYLVVDGPTVVGVLATIDVAALLDPALKRA